MSRLPRLLSYPVLAWLRLQLLLLTTLLALPLPRAQAQEPGAVVDTLAALRRLSTETRTRHAILLEGTVWYADAANGRLILNDSSGTTELLLDLDDAGLQPGDRIRLSGLATLMNRGNAIELTRLAVVDNDGIQAERESSGSVHLDAGRHPVSVDWFNADGSSSLHVEYEGPGLTRRELPDGVLFREAGGQGGERRWSQGLDFRSYLERQWMLPANRTPGSLLLKGVAKNFDSTVAGWREYVGVNFSGYLEVSASGEYRFFVRSGDGARLFIGTSSLRLEKLSSTALPEPAQLFPSQPLQGGQEYVWASMEGRISHMSQIGRVNYASLSSGSDHVRVEVADATAQTWARLLNRRVRLTGVVHRSLSLDGVPVASTLLVQNASQVGGLEPAAEPETEPPTPVAEIERFDRSLLDGKHSVKVRGVVTRVIGNELAVVLQDQSRGIYINMVELAPAPVHLGDLLEVTGLVDPGEFSPFLRARSIRRLGAGVMPVAAVATREELVNGRLHSQYVELEGYVLAVDRKTVTLRSNAGILRVEIETETSEAWLNAVIRMRGCLRVFWDLASKQITVGKIGLDYADISIERPPPADLFDAPHKQAAELLRFDPYAIAYQRARLTARVIHSHGTELLLMDEGRGLRVTLAAAQAFGRGDLVEIAGFPEFDGPSPHFAHAVARRVGTGDLPAPHMLYAEELLRDDYDATLVSLDAELLGTGFQDGRRSLQLRAGSSAFVARLDSGADNIPAYEPGSRLRLTGVYLGLGGNRSLGRPVEAFELLLPSASAIQVLATPPWWTLARMLALVGILLVVLSLAFLWIHALRRQVAVQTEQLRVVLQERHRVQQEEAVTRERSRLAYDLHDELGAGLSEIGMLGTLAASQVPPDRKEEYLLRLRETVRTLIASLDEIVWAVNPRYDPVSSLVGYYTAHAQQYLALASLSCRLDIAEDLPSMPLSSRSRYSLFLAFKETLTNVVKHARASSVEIRIRTVAQRLEICVADNGCGLPNDAAQAPGMDGLASIRDRMAQLDGECTAEPNEGGGTRITLRIPLSRKE
jgi:signal transduction histidine kinase